MRPNLRRDERLRKLLICKGYFVAKLCAQLAAAEERGRNQMLTGAAQRYQMHF
jgi:hypothetical protein